MGAFLLFGLLMVSLLTGMIMEQRAVNSQQPERSSTAASGAAAFLSYKRAVQAYVYAHPSVSGSIDIASLPATETQTATSAMKNVVLRTGSGSKVVTWWDVNSGALNDVLSLADGDRAIGVSTGQHWTTPAGGDMGPLPVTVPSGDVVSFVIFTGSGY